MRELTFRVLLSVEGREDRARTARFKSALLSQPPEGVASAFQLGDPSAERLHALIRKRAGTRPVFSGVEVKQFADLFEREAGGLGVPDELQAPDMVGSVAANSIPF